MEFKNQLSSSQNALRILEIVSKVLIIGLVLSSVALFLGSGIFWYKTQRFIATAHTAQGTVLDLVNSEFKDASKGSRSCWKPVIQFITSRGNKVKFSPNSCSNPPRYRRGDHVTILYEVDNPEFAKLNNWTLYAGSIVCLIITVSFIFAALVVWGGLALFRRLLT